MKKVLVFASFVVLLLSCHRNTEDTTPTTPAANYADSIKRNLWAYYPLTNGSYADSSGHNRNLRGLNGITFGTDKSGTANNALLFDGVNDYAVIDSGIYLPAGDFAISFLMNPQKTIGGRIFNKANFNDAKGSSINFGFDDDNANSKLTFAISNNPNICSSLWAPNTASNLYTNTVLSTNTWYSVVAEHKAGIMRVYLNGQLISANASQNASFIPCSNAPLYFGIWWLGDFKAYKGTLDNIRVYNRALSYQEIQYLASHSL